MTKRERAAESVALSIRNPPLDGIRFLIARLEISVICPGRLKAGDVVACGLVRCCVGCCAVSFFAVHGSLAFTARVGKVAHSDVLGKK